MKKPKVLVFAGYGLNCEEETRFAFELAGATADIVHINDLMDDTKKLGSYQIVALPGGFSYGDDTGSGNAFAWRLRNHLWSEVKKFVEEHGLVIGICNGCQILTHLGFVPATSGMCGVREVALLHNDSARYAVRWTDLSIEGISPWLAGIKTISLPIAHGEGKFYADRQIMARMIERGHIALRYIPGEMCTYFGYASNPTGTMGDIAGIIDESGRIFGIMPHPERAIFFTQLPHWTYLKERYQREGKPIPRYGPGLQIFKNAVAYCLEQ